MAKVGSKIYYWDSCTLIAWIDGGKGYPDDVLAGLDEIAKEVTENKAILCTSVIIDTELLESKLTDGQTAKLQDLFKRRNVTKINVDTRITARSSGIRNHYNERGTKISTPDAIHLATAIIYKVDEFHTLDNGLLGLNGDVAGYPLHIRMPSAIQPSLFGRDSKTNSEEERDQESTAKATQPSPAEVQRSGGRYSKDQSAKAETDKEKGRA